MKYRADIDGLRAVAVWLVIIFHYQSRIPINGYMGVDVFFVISGFLITSIICSEINEGKFLISRFYERRIRRILPAMFLILFASSVLAYFLFLPIQLVDFGKSIISTNLFVSNIFFWSDTGYFHTNAILKPLLHMWSLSVEEQFYIFYPLLLVLLHKYFKNRVKLCIGIIFLCSLGLNIYFVHIEQHETSFYLFPMRAWELLAGAMLALNFLPELKGNRAAHITGTLGFILCCIGVFMPLDNTNFPGLIALLPTLGATLLIYSGSISQHSWTSRILSFPLFTFMGKISYSLYLWHWPLFAFLSYYTLDYAPLYIRILLIGLCVFLSYLSWKFIEQPFRKNKNQLTRNKVFTGAVYATCIFIFIGTLVLHKDGKIRHFEEAVLEVASPQIGGEYLRAFADRLKTTYYTIGVINVPEKARFIVWGDSHAEAISPAFHLIAKQKSVTGLLLKDDGCLLSAPAPKKVSRLKSCEEKSVEIYEYIKSAENLKTVFIVQRWVERTEEWFARYGYHNSIEESYSSREKSLVRIVDGLHKAGKHIVFIAEVPRVGNKEQDIASIVARIDHYGRSLDIRPKTQAYLKKNKRMNDILKNLSESPYVDVIWPHKKLCGEIFCTIMEGHKLYYYDDDHLSSYGAEYISDIILPYFD